MIRKKKKVVIKIKDWKKGHFHVDENDLISPEMQKSMQKYHEEVEAAAKNEGKNG